jgi:hypothetical protein
MPDVSLKRKRTVCHRRLSVSLFGATPHFVADFSGDQSIANVEVVNQPHLYFRTNWQRTILESVADDSKSASTGAVAIGFQSDTFSIEK